MASSPAYPEAGPTELYGLDRDALAAVVERFGAPAFHAEQIYRWLYSRHVHDPDGWTDLPKTLRARLREQTRVGPGRLAERHVAGDGTIKFRVELAGGDAVETVYMVQADRVTLCVSSQVGCALACDFCLTGRMGLVRHLTAGEIVGQIARVCEDRGLFDRPFTIVFMGMGEPLHNFDAVAGAVRILTDENGFALGRRRITVSTSGLVPAIERLAREPVRPRLAVSLNATTNAVRDRIMPINRKYPIEQLVQAGRRYAETTGEPFTFEYVLLEGVNTSEDDVTRLAGLARQAGSKINLIPFNPVPGWLSYRPPSESRVLEIRDRLLAEHVRASVRWSRGADARAACGQLALLPDPKPDEPHTARSRRR